MIDVQALRNELEQARAARLAAEAASSEVEELLWEVQQGPRIWRRLALVETQPEPQALAA